MDEEEETELIDLSLATLRRALAEAETLKSQGVLQVASVADAVSDAAQLLLFVAEARKKTETPPDHADAAAAL